MRARTVAAVVLLAAGLVGCGLDDDPCGDPTITGTSKNDVLRGTPGPDVIAGYAGNDRLIGLGGDDVLCGGDDRDVLVGGPGNDRLYGGRNEKEVVDTDAYDYLGDTLAGGPGDDLLDVGADGRDEPVAGEEITWAGSGKGIRLDAAKGTATGEGADRIIGHPLSFVGSRLDDRLAGSDRAETIIGNGGRDRIIGRGGSDTLWSGTKKAPDDARDREGDVLDGGSGSDDLTGAGGDDVLLGGPGNDGMRGGFGRDRLLAGAGADQLFDSFVPGGTQEVDGGPGHDVLSDFLLYPAGKTGPNDAVVHGVTGTADLAAGWLRSSSGGGRYDVALTRMEGVSVSFGSWTLLGSASDDEFIGGNEDQGPATIDGRGGDDQVFGTAGFDTLRGGPGRDTLLKTSGGDDVSGFEKVR